MTDTLLEILHSKDLSADDIEHLSSNFTANERDDVITAYRILSLINQYLDETNSWSFCMLSSYDFENQARQFDLDLAIVVGNRSEFLLVQLAKWNIRILQEKVSKLTCHYTDAATTLTTLVLRIVSHFSQLEFKLQLALSRSTLIKIHHELAGLIHKFPSDPASGPSLIDKYKAFVIQLISELEENPSEEVQKEMFQAVRDLHKMFIKFSAQYQNQVERPEQQHKQRSSYPNHHYDSPPASSATEEDYEEIYDYDYPTASKTYKHHRPRTSSVSTALSSVSNASALSDDMPSIMQAFDNARRDEQLLSASAANIRKSHHNQIAVNKARPSRQQRQSLNTHMEEPVQESKMSRSISIPMRSSSSMHSSLNSVLTTPSSPSSTETPVQPKRISQSQSTGALGALRSSFQKPQNSSNNSKMPENLEVKMIDDRMMVVLPNDQYMDMQEWLNKKNNVQAKPVASPQLPTTKTAPNFSTNSSKIPASTSALPSVKTSTSTNVPAGALTSQPSEALSWFNPFKSSVMPGSQSSILNSLQQVQESKMAAQGMGDDFERNYRRTMEFSS